MARNINIAFNSEKDSENTLYQLASGYISQTTILFEKEYVVAVIEAKGSVEFYDTDDVLIASGSVPVKDSGKGLYMDVACRSENDRIELRFPIYEWIDNYPNCDGEHDRWDTRIVGYHTLVLDLTTGSVL